MVASTTYLVRCFGSLQTNENKKLSSITPKKPKRKRKTFQLESILEKKKHSSIPKTSHLHTGDFHVILLPTLHSHSSS